MTPQSTMFTLINAAPKPSQFAAPKPSQFAALGIGIIGLGALVLRARKRKGVA